MRLYGLDERRGKRASEAMSPDLCIQWKFAGAWMAAAAAAASTVE